MPPQRRLSSAATARAAAAGTTAGRGGPDIPAAAAPSAGPADAASAARRGAPSARRQARGTALTGTPGPGSAAAAGRARPTRSGPDGPRLSAGVLLAGRYRLERLQPGPGPSWLWRAEDTVLARPVGVRVLEDPDPPLRSRLAAAATLAGRLNSPRLAATFDSLDATVLLPDGTAVALACLVVEWLDGGSWAALITREGPLPAQRAAALAREAAFAVAAAHAAGVAHGAVHPHNLVLTAAGAVKLTDTVVAAALHPASTSGGGHAAAAASAGQPGDDAVAADTRGVARALYAALTARWPTDADEPPTAAPAPGAGVPSRLVDPTHGLAPAPRAEDRLCSPRQVQAGVPRALDAIVLRVLEPRRRPTEPPLRDPVALAEALTPVAAPALQLDTADGEADPGPAATAARVARWLGRARPAVPWAKRLLLVGLLGVLGMVAYNLGIQTATVPGTATVAAPPFSRGAPGARRAALPAAATVPVPVVGAHSFDPPPGDGTEDEPAVGLAYDGDPGRGWTSEFYATAALGGLKPGVGVVFDLGSPVALRQVNLVTLGAPETVQIRSSAAPGGGAGSTLAAYPVRGGATVTRAGAVLPIVLTPGPPARYWLVWLTALPKTPQGYQGSIGEVEFRR